MSRKRGAEVTVYLTPTELRALDAYRPKGAGRAFVLRVALRAYDRMRDAHLTATPRGRA